jgi:hypothetical protein
MTVTDFSVRHSNNGAHENIACCGLHADLTAGCTRQSKIGVRRFHLLRK